MVRCDSSLNGLRQVPCTSGLCMHWHQAAFCGIPCPDFIRSHEMCGVGPGQGTARLYLDETDQGLSVAHTELLSL